MATAKHSSTSTTRARKGETTAPKLDPTGDAATPQDTLSYAMQSDADPQQVLSEIVQLVTPYCQSRATLGHLHSLMHSAAVSLAGDRPDTSARTVPPGQFDGATLKLERAAALTATMGMLLACSGSEQPSGDTIFSAMTGIGQLIESAIADLHATEGGAA